MVEFTILALKRPFQVMGLGPSHQYRFLNWETTAFRRRLQQSDESVFLRLAKRRGLTNDVKTHVLASRAQRLFSRRSLTFNLQFPACLVALSPRLIELETNSIP